ncbi:MAG TPA: hypothetical protein DCL77_08245 [Prolixibacteraceae bacterium]|jgi:PAS domain S-box-containing protein|nr:hypothetical protein [Prolixibacteraceae bacterium]
MIDILNMRTNLCPNNSLTYIANSNNKFSDLFDLEEIQRLQDLFAEVNSVASIITYPDGSPVTRPSNFTRFCNEIIRLNDQDCLNCFKSGSENSHLDQGAKIQLCPHSGLLNSCIEIRVGGKHIANWILGQVRHKEKDHQRIESLALEIGADSKALLKAYSEVPAMPIKQFHKVSNLLFELADQLTINADCNLHRETQMSLQAIASPSKKAEKALKDSEEKYRSMFADSPQPMWIYDLETLVFLEVNDAAINHYGYSRQEFMGMTIKEIRPPEDISALLNDAKFTVRDFNPPTEWRHIKKNREVIFVEISSHSVIFNGKNARHVLIHDLTGRKHAEDRLNNAKRLYAVLSQINQAIVHIKDQQALFDKICQVAIEYGDFRMAWIGLFDEANQRLIPVIHAGYEDGYLDQISIIIGKQPRGQGPTGLAFQEGKIISCADIATDPKMIPWRENALKRGYCSLASVPFRLKGKTIGTLTLYANDSGFFSDDEQNLLQEIGGDISFALDTMALHNENKRANIELIKAKEKAEESDRLKSAFLANMSHEVRTPLNSIIGFSELLADADFGPELRNEFIQHIVTNGNHLLTIISDIMDISKMESGKITLRKSEIKVGEFISTIKEQFSFQAEAKNLELKLTYPATEEEPIVFADSERLSQIFNNLISNALKFTPYGTIEISHQLKDSFVEFCISDTGIGIGVEYHDIIFERFRQVESEKTRTYGGNGLGLAITKNLVELMGGKIWVQSESGKGSSFYFTLPEHSGEQ